MLTECTTEQLAEQLSLWHRFCEDLHFLPMHCIRLAVAAALRCRAPEQHGNLKLNGKADIWAWAATMLFMWTGQHLFAGASDDQEIFNQVQHLSLPQHAQQGLWLAACTCGMYASK